MKKNEALFKINDKSLYREKNLVIVQVPIFFVCKDEKEHRYLVLLLDFYSDEYLVCPISNEDLLLMLTGEITMRKPFLAAKELYLVKAGESPDEDEVKEVTYLDLGKDILPEENALFEIGEDEGLKAYVFELKELNLDFNCIKANVEGISTLVKGLIDSLTSDKYADLVVNMNTVAEVLIKYDDAILNYAKVFTERMSIAEQALAVMTAKISSQYEVSIEADCEYVSPEYVEKENNSFSYSSTDMKTSYYHVGEYISIKVA